MSSWATILAAVLAATLASAARADDPTPGCERGVLAGRVELDAGDPAPHWCACYDDDSETCLLMRYRRCRAELTETLALCPPLLEACETSREGLQRALVEAAGAVDRARSDLQAAAPPWWDRAWVGFAGTVAGLALLAAGVCALDDGCTLRPWRDR